MTALPPGSTIGILGGGQLGRMLAISAAQLGYRVHIYAPQENAVAAEVAAYFTTAQYHEPDRLEAFAKSCDVISYEFENIPVRCLALIEHIAPMFPPPGALDIAQSRIDEKLFAEKHGASCAPFAIANRRDELDGALSKTGLPAIIKTNRMGYDGKGQVRVGKGDNLDEAWHIIGRQAALIEGVVAFEDEFSVILVRSVGGEIRYWQSTRNAHENGILAHSSLPAGPLIESQQAEARKLSADIADALGYVGVLTCEFFATASGPVFNEMAPRVHNSGHWTVEGAVTSQFENHIRAICGLPLGDTSLIADRMEMENIVGETGAKAAAALAGKDTHIHLYGKDEARDGRKMGHLTRLYR